MTTRYKCLNKDVKHTFNGCNPALIRQLPLHLQAEFLAVLSHRSGLSKVLYKVELDLTLQYYTILDHDAQYPYVLSMLQSGQYPEFS
ncbi:hypothetical protein INT47_010690 [Mucor saturninus]|uniref:Uncharacterized protein n=1 Tax=Mucor saturninus TaxID=64648 RepID=A0A8H7V161_9FUNG|nr:hypothetical protein INT47_010690 [Mucor saturninus]